MTDQASNDSGSRRLRREEERRRLAAEQGLPQETGSERSRRDELSPLPSPLGAGRRDEPSPPSPLERDRYDDVAPRVSPVERTWGDDLAPRSSRSEPATLSRRELRERAAAAGSSRPEVDETRPARRAEPVGDRPAAPGAPPESPERPLSRRELRERAERAAGGSVVSRSRQDDAPEPEVSRHEAPAGRRRAGSPDDLPGRRDASDPMGMRRDDTPRGAEAPAARRVREPYADPSAARDAAAWQPDAAQAGAQSQDAQRFDQPTARRVRERPETPRDEVPETRSESAPTAAPPTRRDASSAYATEESSEGISGGPTRPAQPERASTAEYVGRGPAPDEARAPGRPEPAAERASEPSVSEPSVSEPSVSEPSVSEAAPPSAPARISPQARAAAIKAQAARAQAEREDATRAHYEQLQSRRAAQAASGQAGAPATAGQAGAPVADGSPSGSQPPAAMWGQRQEPNGSPQPPGSDGVGQGDRPPVRRVVLPPSMSAGTSPADVPVLGQWQGQPQQYQAAAPPQQQMPPQQPYQAAAPPQQPFQPAAPPQQQMAPQQPFQPAAPPQQQMAPQQPYQAAAPPQQFQGIPPSGPMPANGQPFATVTVGGAQTATAPARPVTGGPGAPPNVDGSGPLPRWGSVGASGAWSPTPSYGPNGLAPNGLAPTGPAGQGIPASPNGAPAVDDDVESERRHPYTWLHMIVLVLVAFVLGMLIFMLVIKDTAEDGAAAAEGITAASLDGVTERVGA